jgi:hypothetical protein
MHFVGDGVGFFRGVLVIGIQRFRNSSSSAGSTAFLATAAHRLGPLFGIGLRFFVLGLGKLFGKRGYIFSERLRHSEPARP